MKSKTEELKSRISNFFECDWDICPDSHQNYCNNCKARDNLILLVDDVKQELKQDVLEVIDRKVVEVEKGISLVDIHTLKKEISKL